VSSSGQNTSNQKRLTWLANLRSNNYFGPVLSLVIIIAIFAVGSKGVTLRLTNFQNILNLGGLTVIAVLGLSFVLLLGAIDLSVEGIIALSAVVSGLLMPNQLNSIDLGYLVWPIAMFVGFGAGVLNGVINTKLRMPSFLVTLGMWYVTRGLAVIIIRGQQLAINDDRFKQLVDGKILGIPSIAVIAAVFIALIYILQKRTSFGKYVMAIGGNEALAKQAGVNISLIKILVFGISGALFGATGFFLVCRLQIASAVMGKGMLFPVVTAAVLGGNSLSGGTGGALYALIGAVALTFLANGMVIMNINVFAQQAVNGIVLIIAVALSMDRKKMGLIK
jgi:ribose transport system permease protein